MSEPKPPLRVELLWSRDLEFGATSGNAALVLDGNSKAGPSPVQLLGFALAGCMAADVADIVQKGRHPLTGLHVSLTAERAVDPPRRLLRVLIHFAVHGAVPDAAVDRAIALSRDKYCSVWHSLRPDIELTTEFTIHS